MPDSVGEEWSLEGLNREKPTCGPHGMVCVFPGTRNPSVKQDSTPPPPPPPSLSRKESYPSWKLSGALILFPKPGLALVAEHDFSKPSPPSELKVKQMSVSL